MKVTFAKDVDGRKTLDHMMGLFKIETETRLTTGNLSSN